ncbi:hypothetical protein [Lyngbya aestuarii]
MSPVRHLSLPYLLRDCFSQPGSLHSTFPQQWACVQHSLYGVGDEAAA